VELVSDIRLADAKRILSYPPVFRRGIQQLVKPAPNPAAGANFKFTIPSDYWDRLLTISGLFTASATAGGRSLAIQFQDGDGYIFNQTPLIAQVVASQALNFYADLAPTTIISSVQGSQAQGTVTSPGALATIATTASVPAGTYNIAWQVSLSGTLGAVDANNFRLVDSTGNVLVSINPSVAGTYPQEAVEVTTTTAGAVLVQSILAGTVASVYGAQLSVIPASQFSAQATIPDLILESGWSINVVAGNIQAGDQFSATGLILERYSSKYARGGFYETALGEIREYIPQAVEIP
jgi:hypothetical protein